MQKHHIDWPLFVVLVALLLIGLVMVFSTSSTVGLINYQDSYFFIKRQLFYFFLGIIAFTAGLKIPHLYYKKIALPGLIGSTILLGLTLVPGIGVRILGATRWLNLGIIQIQPVEISKFFITVFLAASLENKFAIIGRFRKGVLPILLILGLPVLILMLQPDLANSILILAIMFILIFLSHSRIRHMGGLIAVGLTFLVLNILTHPYQLDRIRTFMSPVSDPLGRDYHIAQSLIAVGSGGLFGNGIGQSRLKYFYLPLHYSDFIYAIICEEGGFILATTIILMFAFIFYKGVSIARRVPRTFSRNLALAQTMFIVFQAFINIGMVIGSFPVTGIPLTYISLGGTSLISSIFSIGVILNISKYVQTSPLKKAGAPGQTAANAALLPADSVAKPGSKGTEV